MSKTLDMEQLAAAQKANAEVMMALVRTGFDGAERLTTLNIAASRDLLNNVVANTKEMMSAKDAADLANKFNPLTQPGTNKLMDYSRSLYEISTEMQKQLTSVMQSQYEALNKKATSAIEKGTASAPIGGDVFAAAMKSMLNASNTAYDNISSMAKQLSDIAESNMKAASTATTKAVSATAAAAKKSK
ncbi:MAG: phasin family protein [Proteobacteria bacterium]|nr:phasin family protein [Pseudomonadota bacterium]